MQKKIRTALISVFYKDGLENIIPQLDKLGITIYSTGGTQEFITKLGVPCIPVESLTGYPPVFGGRVKTLHPALFGGILARRDNEADLEHMKEHKIPAIDLVIVDLYPFEETVRTAKEESAIIEKIDVGGPSMIRAAAKNHRDVLVIAAKKDYPWLEQILQDQAGETTLEQRRAFAIKGFDICTAYDNAISCYFNGISFDSPFNKERKALRYGENPHQSAAYFGNLEDIFEQLHGKELSYNNLVDVDAAISVIKEFRNDSEATFGIIKHTNVCGFAKSGSVKEAWDKALAGDPESAFGGVLVSSKEIDAGTAAAINELFFEVLIAPSFHNDSLPLLKSKKNRILLRLKDSNDSPYEYRSILNGILMQEKDIAGQPGWNETGGRESTPEERNDLEFANILCKHLKSNAIALVKEQQL
ncbi:MAG TPA: bifunctional phosphoribosylaminoimidazolecarboxamide formyltransferase/IMP cyclohydrolase, partial [Ferruginibacter sp.]|nr:bifunctional phosphoribosylaminoimidazolecarboxamide formyltransferase/IMP cyclohydrolase [Ferruginibacter sp.]